MKTLLNFITRKISRIVFKFMGSDYKIQYLRKQGVKIGTGCFFLAEDFGTEPYLIEIGDHVAIANGARLINHEGGVWLFREEHPGLDIFGKIVIGKNTFIGMDCLLLPGTEIGENCIIGAGSVVRGKIAENSVVMGNPAKVIMKTSFAEKFMLTNKNRINTKLMNSDEKKAAIMEHFFTDQSPSP